MFTLEKQILEKRGARGCSNSSYRLVALTCCGRQVVEDDELSDLYIDPADLSKNVTLLKTADSEATECPLCGAATWDFVVVDDVSEASLEWNWACPTT